MALSALYRWVFQKIKLKYSMGASSLCDGNKDAVSGRESIQYLLCSIYLASGQVHTRSVVMAPISVYR